MQCKYYALVHIKRITPEASRTLHGTGAVGLPSRFDSVRAASSASLLPMMNGLMTT